MSRMEGASGDELWADNVETWAQLVRCDMDTMGWPNVEALQAEVTNRARFKATTNARSRGAP